MEYLTDFLHQLRDVEGLIRWGGLAMVCAIVFAETGLLVGFFLPGDSLLFTAGFLAAGGHINIALLLVLVTVAAISGDQVGYLIGYKTGTRIFQREDSRFFKREHLLRTQAFYEKHGGKTIILARFVPIVRTFAPFVAGIGKMSYRRFLSFNVIGAVAWVAIFAPAGYVFGNLEPVKKNFHYVVLGIIAVSLVPVVIEFVRARAEARKSAT